MSDDLIPCAIFEGDWSCLDCTEHWTSQGEHCPAASDHFHQTGHRLNGTVITRYRMKPVEEVTRNAS